MVWVLGRLGLLVCPAFSTVEVSWSGRVRRWSVSGDGWWAGREHGSPQRRPRVCPGPVGGQVQDSAALWAGQPGGHGDQVAAQGGAAGDRVCRTGEGAGGAEQVVGDRGADRPRT